MSLCKQGVSEGLVYGFVGRATISEGLVSGFAPCCERKSWLVVS